MIPGRLRRGIRAALVATLLSVPRVAHAQDVAAESDGHLERGVALRRTGHNAEALAEFRLAYAVAPTPRARAQIGLALQALGDWADAERALDEALRSPDDVWVARYREVLEGSLATVRTHLANLYVEVDVPSAELLIDGAGDHVLPSGDAIRVAAGTIDLEVRSPGFVASRRAITVLPGAEAHERFVLEPVAPPALPPPGPVHADGPPASPARHPARAVAALTAAAALSIGGVVAWRVREDDVAHFNDDSRCRVGALTRAEQCGGVAAASNVALGVEIGAFAAAGVAAALGAWLLWAPSGHAVALTTRCGPAAPLGLLCVGRF